MIKYRYKGLYFYLQINAITAVKMWLINVVFFSMNVVENSTCDGKKLHIDLGQLGYFPPKVYWKGTVWWSSFGYAADAYGIDFSLIFFHL